MPFAEDAEIAEVRREKEKASYQTVGFLERGDYHPSLSLAFALSQYFGVPIEAIFSPQPFQPLKQWPG